MRLVAHCIQPNFREFDDWEFSDNTKLSFIKVGSKTVLGLKPLATGFFSTDADLLARSPVWTPLAVRSWAAFGVDLSTPKDSSNAAVTSVQYRLNDGTDDRYWDGGTWAVAGAGDWNTRAELYENIGDFPLGPIRVVFNLVTTDKRLSPSVSRAVVFANLSIDSYDEEWILRSFIPYLKAGLRPRADYRITWPGGSVFNFGAMEQEEPPGDPEAVLTVTEVFNLDTDPLKRTNLLDTYVGGVVTLTGAEAADADMLFMVEYQPLVVFRTHPDYNEVSAVPSVIIEEMEEEFVGELPFREVAVNPTDFSAISVRSPRQVNYLLTLRVVAARSTDLWRVRDALRGLLRGTPVLSSAALDSRVSLVIETDFASTPRQQEVHLQDGRMTVGLWGAELWIHPSEAGFGVGELVVDFKVQPAEC